MYGGFGGFGGERVTINGGRPEDLIGKRVQFHGLVSRNDLNGKRGTIFEWLDSRQRYNVRLGSMSDEMIAVKACNISEIETVVTNNYFEDVKTEGEKLVEEGGLATQRLDGATVEFQWLEGRADLNGHTAVVEGYLPARGRYNVKIAGSNDYIAVKPGNIKTIAPYTHHYLKKAADDLAAQQEVWKSVGPGDLLVVKTEVTTDSKEPITLPKGTRGTVVRMDKDGDAIIKFDGHNTRHWIYKEKFSQLTVRMKAEEGSAPSPEKKSPLKQRSANTPTKTTQTTKPTGATQKGVGKTGLRVVF